MSVLERVAGPRLDAWQDYAPATRGPGFAEYCSTLQHAGDFEGDPFVLEPWQRAIANEILAVRDGALAADGSWLPWWRSVAVVIPRGNGKSPLIAAMAVDHLFNWPHDPRVFIGASDEAQARLLFEFTVGYLRSDDALVEGVDYVVRDYVGEISLVDRPGFIRTVATNKPGGLHGERPTLALLDELHEWRTPTQLRSHTAIVSGAKKRRGSQVIAISTAGEVGDRDTGLLGVLVDTTHQRGETEQVHAALRISRDHASRSIVFEWSAPTQDPEDIDAIKLANPASWRTVEDLVETSKSPDLTPQAFLQLFANVWSESADAWIKRGTWGSMLIDGAAAPRGAKVWVGVDAATTDDCTAAAWAWHAGDGRIGIAAHVWSAKHGNAAHELVDGGAIDTRCVVGFVRDHLAGELGLEVVEVVYDKNRFEVVASMLSDEGFDVADAWTQGANRSRAWTHFYGAVRLGELVHDGDQVLAEHVCGAQAQMTDQGWKVSKLRQRRSQKIDALVAAAMAAWRCGTTTPDEEPFCL